MSKDKPKNKEFLHNPFKTLKGRVSSAPPPKPPVKRVGSAAPGRDDDVDDGALFGREMTLLGVERQPLDEDGEPRERPLPDDTATSCASAAGKSVAMSEEELFLQAMGQMDAVFQDEFPLEETPVATPGRMKQLRQGRLVPEATLDLHGASREQAREKVRFFLEDSVFQGRKTVLVITGRGKGSPDGPVLRSDMQRYLTHEAKAWVVEWGQAPARYGGEGALVVFLKTTKRNRK